MPEPIKAKALLKKSVTSRNEKHNAESSKKNKTAALKAQVMKTAKLSQKKPQEILRQYRVAVTSAGLKNHSVYKWIESARNAKKPVKVDMPKGKKPKTKKIESYVQGPQTKAIAIGAGKEQKGKSLKEHYVLFEKWDEKQHPRAPEGTSRGGEWVSKGVHLPQLRAVAKVTGDDWNKKTAVKLALEYEQVKHHMHSLAKEAVGSHQEVGGDDDEDEEPGITYDSWDVLPDHVQSETEEKWKENSHSEFLDHEIDNWQSESAYDDAGQQVEAEFGDDDDWVGEALDEFLEEHRVPYDKETLYDSISMDYETGNGSYKWKSQIGFEIDDDKLKKPKNLKYDPDTQAAFAGLEPGNASGALTKEMREALKVKMIDAFANRLDKVHGDLEPPSYLEDSVSELQSDYWDQKDDEDKFKEAESLGLVPDDEDPKGGKESLHLDKLPDHFDPLNESSGMDYKRTQALARAISAKRAVELIQERIPNVKEQHLAAHIQSVDRTLWNGWKGSSQSEEGWLLQVATAEELGGRMHIHNGNTTEAQIKKTADNHYRNIGGYEGVKAYIRAKWETTQYLLEKADKHNLRLYRGLRINLPEDTHEEADGFYTKFLNVHIKRNGCASFTTSPSVANDWGAGHGAQKVVIRAEVPRTAIISIPAYGINIQAEKEVVVAGTGWKTWEAWKGKAP